MAYTPPLGNAINFDGSGAAYTPPLGNAVNFDTVGGSLSITLGGQEAGAQGGLLSASVTGSAYSVPLTGLQAITLQGGEVPGYGASPVGRQATILQGMMGGVIPPEVVVALTGRQVAVVQGVLGGVVGANINVPLTGQSLYVNHVLGRLVSQVVALVYYGFLEPPATTYEYPQGQSVTAEQGTLTPVISRFAALRGQELKTRSFNFIVSTDRDVQVPLNATELVVQQAQQDVDWLSHFRPLEWVEAEEHFDLSTSGDADPNNNFTVATDSNTHDNWSGLPPVVLSNGDALVWGGKRYFELAVQLPPEGAKPWPIPAPPRPPYNAYFDPTSYFVSLSVGISFRSRTYLGDPDPTDDEYSIMASDVLITIQRDFDFNNYPWDPDLRPGITLTPAGSGTPTAPWPIDYDPSKRIMVAVDVDRSTDFANWGKVWLGYDGEWFVDTLGYINFGGGDPELGAPPLSALLSDPVPAEPLIIMAASSRSSNDSQFPPPPVIPITTPTQIRLYAREDNQLFRPKDFYPWDEAGPRRDGLRLTGLRLVIEQGFFAGLGPPPLDGLQVVVQQGTFTLDVGISLIGLQATVEQGFLIAAKDIIVPLAGQQVTVQRGVFLVSTGPSLTGLELAVAPGTFAIERGVVLEGQELLVVRGMFPYFSVDLPLPPSVQATVELGRLGVDITVQLAGQSLVAATGVFVPVFNLHPVGQQARVSQGMFVPLLHPVLSGLSLVASNGVLKISQAVAPTGLQATLASGQPGFLYDCNVLITGVQATGMVGTDPTQTNVPLPSKDVHLWAQQEVEKLFNNVEPTR